MTDDDLWIYFDGPEPDVLRPLLAAMREVPAPTPEDTARVMAGFQEKLEAVCPRPPEPEPESVAEETRRDAAPGRGTVATLRAPSFVGRVDEVPPPSPVAPPAPSAPAGVPVPIAVGTPVARAPAHMVETLKAAVMQVGLGETFPVGDDSIARAVAAVPFAGSGVPDAVVPVPALTLRQYASLCAELALRAERPERAEEKILVDYHVVNRAARVALDEHWRRVLAEQPGVRAEFERCFALWTAHLREQARAKAR